MEKALERMVKEGMRARSGERVLVVFDRKNKRVGEYLYGICGKIGARVEHILIAKELTKEMAEHMKKSDVVMLAAPGLSWTEAVKKARDGGARIGRIDVSPETADALDVDYAAMQRLGERIKKIIDLGSTIKVTSDAGTDMEASIAGREARVQDGVADHDGSFQNYPAGEVSIAPVEDTAEGTVVVDACLAGIGKLAAPVSLDFAKGRVRRVRGDKEAEKFLGEVEACGVGCGRLGEISFGINPRGKLVGSIINDQKILGTFHVAMGSDVYIGGKVKARGHLEAVSRGYKLYVDGQEVRVRY